MIVPSESTGFLIVTFQRIFLFAIWAYSGGVVDIPVVGEALETVVGTLDQKVAFRLLFRKKTQY